MAPIFDFINSDSKEKTNALWGSNGTHMLYGNLSNILITHYLKFLEIFFVTNNMLFLVNTTKDIMAGEEIVISYGKRTFQGTYLTVYGFTVDPKLNDIGKVD